MDSSSNCCCCCSSKDMPGGTSPLKFPPMKSHAYSATAATHTFFTPEKESVEPKKRGVTMDSSSNCCCSKDRPAGTSPLNFPPTKSHAYSATAATHTFFTPEKESDQPKKRGLLCTLLLWSTLALVVFLLLAALFLAFLFLIYRPRLPAFSVSSLSASSLTISAVSASVDSRLHITVTARNSNSKLRFEYGNPLSVSVVIGGVDVADGEFPGFTHRKKNTTVLKATVGSGGQRQVTGEEVTAVEAAGVGNGVATAEVRVDGTVRALFGKLRSPAMVLQVRCKGLKVIVAGSGKSAAAAGRKCEVKIKGKVGKLTV